jgi:phospholipase/lecithinase/hemolysin
MHRLNAGIAMLLLGLIGSVQVQAAGFTSLHVFGDSLSTTEDSPAPSQYFYGGRYCNGRVWIEVLAGWQDLPYLPAQNDSTFGNDIEDVESALATYTAPADAATALFVLWVSGADFANFMFAGSGLPYEASNLAVWNTFLTDTLDSHEAVISTLYGKGVRNLILPNLPDLSVAPVFGLSPAELNFVKDRVQDFNSGLEGRLATLLPTLPGLRVWTPDVFNLIEGVLADPAAFGLQNPVIPGPPDTFEYGLIPAFDAGGTPDLATGPGTDYVFWDDLNPTAAVHFIIADLVQDEISPPRIDFITKVPGGFDLQFSNLPAGRPGSIEGSENLAGWSEDAPYTPAATTDTVTLNPTGPMRFFRLDFSSGWTWP